MSASPALPYAHLNLTRNPFGELAEDDLLAVARLEVERWRLHLLAPNALLQLVGEKGRGKTTGLKVLGHTCRECRYVHLAEDGPSRIVMDGPTLLDEAQRLSRWSRVRLWRDLRLRAIGTHVDFERELVRAGRQVLTQQVPTRWNASILVEFVNLRMERFRRDSGPLPSLDLDGAERLIRRYHDDLRHLFGHLYDCLQTQSSPGPIDPGR